MNEPLPTPAADSELTQAQGRIRSEIAKAVVGQQTAITELLAAFVAGGHVLVEGVPGVAKTLLAKALARCLDLAFARVQFTPDLMPADILGTSLWRPNEQRFQLAKGPIFTEVLLADEINRTPPKTQAALLEAMEERQVTIDGVAHPLGRHFFVIATQNPLELEGTYPLPEAQTDRFLMKVRMGYPEAADEVEILKRAHQGFDSHDLDRLGVAKVVDKSAADRLRAAAAAIKVEDSVFRYVAELCRATRSSPRLRIGASPRAAVSLLLAAKASAALSGKSYLTPDDVKAMARPVLRHRLILKSEAEIEGLTVEDAIGALLDEVAVPR
ncbi:MAG: MoxR family ATPase [Myxococcales bacterium]